MYTYILFTYLYTSSVFLSTEADMIFFSVMFNIRVFTASGEYTEVNDPGHGEGAGLLFWQAEEH